MEKMNPITFKGRLFNRKSLAIVQEVASDFKDLGRQEIANTVCELLTWERPNGQLKTLECIELLTLLEKAGFLELPVVRDNKLRGTKRIAKRSSRGEPGIPISGRVGQFAPITLRRVQTKDDRSFWDELVDRYHYLSHKAPCGARVCYFVEAGKKDKTILGCLRFTSPAWKMAPRDRWIGWTEKERKKNLQLIVNNSRFLIFPWVNIKNLASTILSLAARTLPGDWEKLYALRPVLLETLVESERFSGTCYKAANWIHVGTTTGRGRMDRTHKRHGAAPKEIFMYPLIRKFRESLMPR